MKAGADSLPVAALYFAMHLAIDNAVESIDRRRAPYYTLAPDTTAWLKAAADEAGHDELVGLFPTQVTIHTLGSGRNRHSSPRRPRYNSYQD